MIGRFLYLYELRRNMEETARAAYENGSSLIKDALTLFEAGRFPRAAALAILAGEEFSKSFMLINCAMYNRWDSAIFNALFTHAKKQAFSESLMDFLELCDTRNRRINQINQCQLIPIPFSKYPSKEKIEEVISKGKSRIKKPIKDFLKQDCFFVRCDDRKRHCNVSRTRLAKMKLSLVLRNRRSLERLQNCNLMNTARKFGFKSTLGCAPPTLLLGFW